MFKFVHACFTARVRWANPNTTVGKLEGELLQIDCNADGQPQPTVSINGAKGLPLPAGKHMLLKLVFSKS